MGQTTIYRYHDSPSELIEERCFVRELSNQESDAAVSIAEARVLPGVTTRWHQLTATTERYVILQGEGMVETSDCSKTLVGKGDVVVIPPDTPQRITNCGQQDLLFLAVCSPRFSFDAYHDVEDQQG